MEKSWNFVNYLSEPPVARKLAARHTSFVCLTASFQATGGFKFKLFQNACMVYVSIQACLFKKSCRGDRGKMIHGAK